MAKAERERLERLLGEYAPGKVRYTIPAVYYDGELDLEKMEARLGSGEGDGLKTVLGLPSLGVWLPGVEDLVRCEVRYRSVGGGVLERVGMDPGSLGW